MLTSDLLFKATWPSQRLQAASSVPDFTRTFNVNVGIDNDVSVERRDATNVDIEEQLLDDVVQDEYGFIYYSHNTSSKSWSLVTIIFALGAQTCKSRFKSFLRTDYIL